MWSLAGWWCESAEQCPGAGPDLVSDFRPTEALCLHFRGPDRDARLREAGRSAGQSWCRSSLPVPSRPWTRSEILNRAADVPPLLTSRLQNRRLSRNAQVLSRIRELQQAVMRPTVAATVQLAITGVERASTCLQDLGNECGQRFAARSREDCAAMIRQAINLWDRGLAKILRVPLPASQGNCLLHGCFHARLLNFLLMPRNPTSVGPILG